MEDLTITLYLFQQVWFTHSNTENTSLIKNETMNNNLGLNSILEN